MVNNRLSTFLNDGNLPNFLGKKEEVTADNDGNKNDDCKTELAAANKRIQILEQEIEEHNQELNSAKEIIQQHEQQKEKFLTLRQNDHRKAIQLLAGENTIAHQDATIKKLETLTVETE